MGRRAHDGSLELTHDFSQVYEWLQGNLELPLRTAEGTPFTARGSTSQDRQVIIFCEGRESADAYECCWGHVTSCSAEVIDFFCEALDVAVGASTGQPSEGGETAPK